MRRYEGYHRRRGAWRPSERQRQVLNLIAEGRTNSEIGEELGMTANGAKWHVGELLAQTGLDDRRALAEWWRQQEGRRGAPGAQPLLLAWRALGFTAATSAILAAGFVVLAVLGGDDGGSPDIDFDAVLADVTPQREAVPTAPSTRDPTACPSGGGDLRVVDAGELSAQGLQFAGQAFSVFGCDLLAANRPDRAFVRLPLEAGLNAGMKDKTELVVGTSGAGSVFEVDGAEIRVRFLQNTTYDGPGLENAIEAESAAGRHRVAVDSDGGLWVSAAPLPSDAVFEAWTGEAIDVSTATKLARLRADGRPGPEEWAKPAFYFTSCDSEACRVSYRPWYGALPCRGRRQSQ